MDQERRVVPVVGWEVAEEPEEEEGAVAEVAAEAEAEAEVVAAAGAEEAAAGAVAKAAVAVAAPSAQRLPSGRRLPSDRRAWERPRLVQPGRQLLHRGGMPPAKSLQASRRSVTGSRKKSHVAGAA